jgi:hypothetical protein
MNVLTKTAVPTVIPQSFNLHGWHYKLVRRLKDGRGKNAREYAIYRQGDIGFELMVIRRHEKDIKWPNGNVTLAGSEYLPSDSAWGTFGWTFDSLKECYAKIEKLKNA